MLTIYKASAGSGKTFQLALHYVKMVLGIKDHETGQWRLNPLLVEGTIPSQAHRHILAITFTNKATEEMKSRIIESLYAISGSASPEDHPYIAMLIEEFACSFDQLRQAAAKAVVTLLLDFSFFNVSTIDSFFQTVLRTFAFELGIQGDYNIEINTQDVIGNALNIMLDQLNGNLDDSDDPKQMIRVRRWLKNRFSDSRSKIQLFKRKSGHYKSLVKEIEAIFTEEFKPLQSELIDYFSVPERINDFAEELKRSIDRSRKAMTDAIDRMHTALENADNQDKIKATVKKTIAKFHDDFDKAIMETGVNVKKIFTGDYEFLTNIYKGTKLTASQDICDAAQQLVDTMKTHYLRFMTQSILVEPLAHLEFVGVMLRYLDRVREESNLLILDDTSSHISRIIGGSEIPFIYEHLGNHLKHFLIDEFQDTSRLQWKNLLPLVANSHANNDDSLIIGDIKQAIYRFRNSDSSILGYDLENVDFTDKTNVVTRGDSRRDNCNRRTAHGIVKFNNTVMPALAATVFGIDPAPGFNGSEVRQMCDPNKAHLDSRIRIFPFTNPGQDYEPKPYLLDGRLLEQPPISDKDTKIKVIINEIKRQHYEEHYPWSDIAILFRTYGNVNDIIAALIENNIPLQSAESLYLQNSPSVRLLVSILTMLADFSLPEHDTNISKSKQPTDKDDTKVLKSSKGIAHSLFESRYNYFLHKKDGTTRKPADAIQMALDVSNETDTADNGQPAFASLENVLYSILDSHPVSLVATIEAILASGIIPAQSIEAEKDYIAAFSDLALTYSENRDNDINGFLDWWDTAKGKAAIMPPPDCDAVRIMTIHKSKGLEFECVHLVDFDWSLTRNDEKTWIDIRLSAEPTRNHVDISKNVDPDIPTELFPPLLQFKLTNKNLDFPGSPFVSFLSHEKMLSRQDALNLAYVAMTRARTRLNIYYAPNKSNSISKALSTVLDDIVNNGPQSPGEDTCSIPTEAYNAETKALEIYAEATAPRLKKETSVSETADENEETRLAKAYNAKYISLVRPDMVSLVRVDSVERDPDYDDMDEITDETLEDTDVALDQKEVWLRHRRRLTQETTQRGLDLHQILSYITNVTDTSDLDSLIDNAITRSLGSEGFTADNKDEYATIVRNMLTQPDASRWFAPDAEVDNEVSFHRPWQEGDHGDELRLGRTGRIDRLVKLPDGSIEVVDYKFTHAQEKEHFRQVREYITAMRQIFPNRKVRGYLWYYDLGFIKECPEAD